MSAKKVILITCILCVAGAGVAYAFGRRKIKAPVKKKVSVTAGDNTAGTDEGDTLRKGSADVQHVTQLQEALNALHQAAIYINGHCATIKWPTKGTGSTVVSENGKFDDATAAATKFYLNREEVDLDYLELIKKKIAAYKAGRLCEYPMGIAV
jgi:hypothetical protein